MLYNKSAVSRKLKITKNEYNLARKFHPFRLRSNVVDYIQDAIKKNRLKKDISKLANLTLGLHRRNKYDDKHKFEGTRDAQLTWNHKKGHCLEQNILLYTAARYLGIKLKWLIVKNPKDYKYQGIDKVGIHPLLIYNHKGKDYRADSIDGRVCLLDKKRFFIAKENFSFREMVAHYYQDAGEDMGINHRNFKDALSHLRGAYMMDPNNYTIFCSIGDVQYERGMYKRAKQCYKSAVWKAPYIADVHYQLGEFYFMMHQNGNVKKYSDLGLARNAFLKASERPTEDLQILNVLKRRLNQLGEKSAEKKVMNRMMEIHHEKGFLYYFKDIKGKPYL